MRLLVREVVESGDNESLQDGSAAQSCSLHMGGNERTGSVFVHTEMQNLNTFANAQVKFTLRK